jgi:hypothetical protein
MYIQFINFEDDIQKNLNKLSANKFYVRNIISKKT